MLVILFQGYRGNIIVNSKNKAVTGEGGKRSRKDHEHHATMNQNVNSLTLCLYSAFAVALTKKFRL